MKVIIAALLVFGNVALANGPTGPCKSDIEKFCKEVPPGRGAIEKCLKKHEAELSAECKAKKDQVKEILKEKLDGVKEACASDAKKFCDNAAPGRGRIMKCLMKNEASLSEACKLALPGGGKWKKEKSKN